MNGNEKLNNENYAIDDPRISSRAKQSEKINKRTNEQSYREKKKRIIKNELN